MKKIHCFIVTLKFCFCFVSYSFNVTLTAFFDVVSFCLYFRVEQLTPWMMMIFKPT